MENIAKLESIDEIYEYNRTVPSNIQPEMEILFRYAKKVDHITEFGFGRGKSASAFIAARPRRVVSYDIKDHWDIAKKWTRLAEQIGVEFIYIQQSSIEANIEPTDLLFIDSWHTYDFKKKELSLHHDKIRYYIIMHDTKTCARIGEDGSKPGFAQAIDEFLREHPEWKIIEESLSHNGYVVMKRKEYESNSNVI